MKKKNEILKLIEKIADSSFENVLVVVKGTAANEYTLADVVKVEADKVFFHNGTYTIYNFSDIDKAMNDVYGDTWQKMSVNEAQKRYDNLQWEPALVIYIEQKET